MCSVRLSFVFMSILQVRGFVTTNFSSIEKGEQIKT